MVARMCIKELMSKYSKPTWLLMFRTSLLLRKMLLFPEIDSRFRYWPISEFRILTAFLFVLYYHKKNNLNFLITGFKFRKIFPYYKINYYKKYLEIQLTMEFNASPLKSVSTFQVTFSPPWVRLFKSGLILNSKNFFFAMEIFFCF